MYAAGRQDIGTGSSLNSRFYKPGVLISTSPSQMPPKFGGNQGRNNLAGGRKIKQVWKPKVKPSPPPPWVELPRDITANILHRLGAVEMLETAQKVCTTWRSVCKDPTMWRVIDMRNDGNLPYNLEEMCRHSVDRSHGQLDDINLELFASDKLLDYIAESCGELRRLRLDCCNRVSDRGLIEAIKRFPNLEELHIIAIPFSCETIETVGHSCPLLRSFGWTNNKKYMSSVGVGDEVAFAVARSMPGLRYVKLEEGGFGWDGWEAIKDACPHLESFGLRGHFKLKKMDITVKDGCLYL